MKKKKEDAEATLKTVQEKADKADDLETENEVLKASKTKLVAKADSLQSDLDKSKTPKMDADEVNKAVKVRIAVMDAGEKMLSKDEIAKLDEMKNIDIKKAVIKADSPKVDEEKLKDESYVDARFDHIVENFDGTIVAKKKVGEKVVETRKDEGKEDESSDPEAIRQASMEQTCKDSLGPKA